uniref:Uncharacterized protein n=1 Tax=Romanomermis culicivorax TaxID=13658 RepID=A0A915I639_ROMCU
MLTWTHKMEENIKYRTPYRVSDSKNISTLELCSQNVEKKHPWPHYKQYKFLHECQWELYICGRASSVCCSDIVKKSNDEGGKASRVFCGRASQVEHCCCTLRLGRHSLNMIDIEGGNGYKTNK